MQVEELCVVIVDGQLLYDIDIEQLLKEQKKFNIYKGWIFCIEFLLEVVFVEYGGGCYGFLLLKEIFCDYFQVGVDYNKVGICELLKEGQEIVVQVDKEECGNKGVVLIMFILLVGCYMVLMLNLFSVGGVFCCIEGEDCVVLKEVLDKLNIFDDMGVIICIVGVGCDVEELQWDLDYLFNVWCVIVEVVLSKLVLFLIYQELCLIVCVLWDYLCVDIGEILVDIEEMYEYVCEFMQQVMLQILCKFKYYKDDILLFNCFQIELQIEGVYECNVCLLLGGLIVVDQIEVLIVVDVNFLCVIKGSDIEDIVFQINLEVVEEVVCQLCLCDLGGLVVIDFIDMVFNKYQCEVENCLVNVLKYDCVCVQVGCILCFGLLEMSCQCLCLSLGEFSQIVCLCCDGYGCMCSVELLLLLIICVVEEYVMKENIGQVLVQVLVEIVNYLLNEKCSVLCEIE